MNWQNPLCKGIVLGINDDSETYDDIAIGSLRVADVLIKKLKGK